MSRVVFIGLLIYLLVFAGLATLRGEFLAMAIPLFFYLAFGLIDRPGTMQLEIHREIVPKWVNSGETFQIHLNVTNRGQDLKEISLQDSVPMNLDILEGSPSLLCELPIQGSIGLSYTCRATRGLFLFPGVRLISSDRFGLFPRTESYSLKDRILVRPEVRRLKRVIIRPRITRIYAGNIPTRQSGSGVDFYGVRSYQSGDPLRYLNWKSAARHPGLLFTTEFEPERVAVIWLMLDARQRSNIQGPGGSLFEHLVSATAALSHAFLNEGNRVGMLIYGGFLDWTYSGYGKMQRERILQALARARTGESMIFDKLEHLPTQAFPPRSQIVLLSPLHHEDVPILIRWRSFGYDVICICPDPIAFEQDLFPQGEDQELGLRLARLERKLLFSQLRQAGIQLIPWIVSIPIEQVIGGALNRASFRRV